MIELITLILWLASVSIVTVQTINAPIIDFEEEWIND